MPRRQTLDERVAEFAKEDKAAQRREYNFVVHGKRLMVRDGTLVGFGIREF